MVKIIKSASFRYQRFMQILKLQMLAIKTTKAPHVT